MGLYVEMAVRFRVVAREVDDDGNHTGKTLARNFEHSCVPGIGHKLGLDGEWPEGGAYWTSGTVVEVVHHLRDKLITVYAEVPSFSYLKKDSSWE
ncbi:hypothetical protein HZC00_05175 [Candidatus Kaiserbacteria bacterium]|nr:hypothetical protein [Candidatus Kaiserbacteria bacterium]